MFIYEKNKINSETGKLEQTLNITFEGNKPVENPDVVIDKDGVTGIKSDSNAYSYFLYTTSDATVVLDDGEGLTFPLKGTAFYYGQLFNKRFSYSYNVDDTRPKIFYDDGTGNMYFISVDGQNQLVIDTNTEFVVDMENKKIYLNETAYNIEDCYYGDGIYSSKIIPDKLKGFITTGY